ncbi:hypothetical protein ACI2OX_12610 [Bacillus sp. N9]
MAAFEKTFAITLNDSLNCIRKVKDFGITAIEASIIPAKEYGSPLTFKDVLTYRQIVQSTDVPIIIPSQRRLVPADIPFISSWSKVRHVRSSRRWTDEGKH